ncbi:MAG: NUDIX hydrolase [Candidatus Magasanikbacteria bacterium]
MQFKIFTRGIILNNKKDSVLLIKKNERQKIAPGKWLFPGGTLEFNEDIEFCLRREIKEETNLTVSELILFTTKKIIIGDDHWLGIYYKVTVRNEDELNNNEPEKHNALQFFTFDQIPEFGDLDILENIL